VLTSNRTRDLTTRSSAAACTSGSTTRRAPGVEIVRRRVRGAVGVAPPLGGPGRDRWSGKLRDGDVQKPRASPRRSLAEGAQSASAVGRVGRRRRSVRKLGSES
jgi:hypothetical protein